MNLQDLQLEHVASRDAEMHQLRSTLLSKQTRTILLYGLRYIGKTTLLHTLMQELQTGGRYLPVYFDLAENPNRSVKQLQNDLSTYIISAINGSKPDTPQDEEQTYGIKQIETALDDWQSSAELLIVVDELNVLGLNAFGNVFIDGRTVAFLDFLAALGETDRVKYIMVTDGVEHAQVVDTLNSKLGNTQFFQLALLNREAVVRLIRNEYNDLLDWSDDGVVEYLWAITHGHPHLVRQLTSSIFNSAQSLHSADSKLVPVTLSMVGRAITDCIRPTADAPLWVWEQLPPEAQTVASAIAGFGPGQVLIDNLHVELTNARVKNATAELAAANLKEALGYLRSWHLIDGSDQECRFCVELFRRWIAKHHPLVADATTTKRADTTSATSFTDNAAADLFESGYTIDDTKKSAEQRVVEQATIRPTLLEDDDGYEQANAGKSASLRQLIVAAFLLLIILAAVLIPYYLRTREPNIERSGALSQATSVTFLEATATNINPTPTLNPVQGALSTLLDEIPNSDQVWSVTFSPDSQRMAAGLANGTIAVWNLNDTSRIERILIGHTGIVTSLAFDPQSPQWLFSGSSDGTIRIWQMDATDGSRILEGHTDQISAIAITPDGATVISASTDGTVRLWDVETGILLNTLDQHKSAVLSIAISPSGQRLVSGAKDGKVLLWNLETFQLEGNLPEHDDAVTATTFFADIDSRVATASADGTVRLWDLSSEAGAKAAVELQFHSAVNSIAPDPNGRFLAFATASKILQIWDQETKLTLPPLVNQGAPIRTIAYSPNGDYLVSGAEDGMVRRWQIVK